MHSITAHHEPMQAAAAVAMNSTRTDDVLQLYGVVIFTKRMYDYTSFGETFAPNTDTAVDNRFGFTGRTNFTNNTAKDYRYRTYLDGRFQERDPIGYVGGPNLYGYVDQSPVNNIDPFGLLTPVDRESTLQKLKTQFRALCTSGCICSGKPESVSQTDINKCQQRADILAEKYLDSVLKHRNDKEEDDQHSGYMCYQWAGIVYHDLMFSIIDDSYNRFFTMGQIGLQEYEKSSTEHNIVMLCVGSKISGIQHKKGRQEIDKCCLILDPWYVSGVPNAYQPTKHEYFRRIDGADRTYFPSIHGMLTYKTASDKYAEYINRVLINPTFGQKHEGFYIPSGWKHVRRNPALYYKYAVAPDEGSYKTIAVDEWSGPRMEINE